MRKGQGTAGTWAWVSVMQMGQRQHRQQASSAAEPPEAKEMTSITDGGGLLEIIRMQHAQLDLARVEIQKAKRSDEKTEEFDISTPEGGETSRKKSTSATEDAEDKKG